MRTSNGPDFDLPADIDAQRFFGVLAHLPRCLAVLTGTPPDEAVAWVRSNYCEEAVETDEQASFLASFQL